MANFEAVQVYIDQQIDEGLEDGKTPGVISRELADEIAKLFDAEINPATIKKRAQRRKEKNRDICPEKSVPKSDMLQIQKKLKSIEKFLIKKGIMEKDGLGGVSSFGKIKIENCKTESEKGAFEALEMLFEIHTHINAYFRKQLPPDPKKKTVPPLIELTAGNFKSKVLNSSMPALVFFHQDGCGPCRALQPRIESLAQEFAKRKRDPIAVYGCKDHEVLIENGIKTIPTLILFQSGIPCRLGSNVRSKTAIKSEVKSILEN